MLQGLHHQNRWMCARPQQQQTAAGSTETVTRSAGWLGRNRSGDGSISDQITGKSKLVES